MSELFIGGRLVVKLLEEIGAKYVFGIPGGQTLYVTDSMLDSSVRFIHTRHENGAATAADGYGRITGEPGICLATTGCGATNLITGLGGALRDSSPVIALLFQNRLPDAGRGDAQESDHELLFSSICKKYIPVRDASVIPWAVREAYRVAKTGRPGPVVLDFYRDVIEEQEAEYIPADPKEYCYIPEMAASDESIARAAQLIASSEKITIWAGNGVRISGASAKVMELSELLNAPIVTTYNGMCAIDGTFENLLGPRSRHGSKVTRAAIEEADLDIVVGSSLSAISTNRWRLKPGKIIQIDIIPENIGRQYPAATGVIGDAKASLGKLISLLKEKNVEKKDDFLKDLLARKAEWRKELFCGPINDGQASPVPPVAILTQLEKILKPGGVFCVDAGNPGAWVHAMTFPDDTVFMKPVNFGNMGFALGASIGCKFAHPEKEVISLIGDGSLGMTLGDLETIGREQLGIIILLFNDNAFGNIKQEELYKMGEGRYTGVDFLGCDYVDVAKVFGIEGSIVRKAAELPDAFEAARKCGKPYMIEVKLDGSYSVWPEAF